MALQLYLKGFYKSSLPSVGHLPYGAQFSHAHSSVSIALLSSPTAFSTGNVFCNGYTGERNNYSSLYNKFLYNKEADFSISKQFKGQQYVAGSI